MEDKYRELLEVKKKLYGLLLQKHDLEINELEIAYQLSLDNQIQEYLEECLERNK